MSLASSRLQLERKNWRKDYPFGFEAKPHKKADGTTDLLLWNCAVPGKASTPWEGGLYPVVLKFSEHYPAQAPKVAFPKGFVHPNVFDTGDVCLSIIGKGWRPSIGVKDILLGLQDLLDTPNETDPADWEVNSIYMNKRAKYTK